MCRLVRLLITDDRAATAIEYGLILALIAMAIMGALSLFAQVTIGIWTDVSGQVQSVS